MSKEKQNELLINGVESNNSEVISNKQIEEIARALCGMTSGCNKCMFKNATCHEYNEAENLYNEGYRKQEWISVDERLPEKLQRVLINYNGNVCISWLNANSTWFECWNNQVTHWMPLPEPPMMKGGAE